MQCFQRADVVLDRVEMRRCRVWAAIRARSTPARAAVVACPARREWPVIRSDGMPAASARTLSTLEYERCPVRIDTDERAFAAVPRARGVA